jgi:8-oxo-dGTP pyrophosphatase MutT (NUDIX family)
VDNYNGVIIAADSLPAEPAAFSLALQASLAAWRAAGRRGVWLSLPLSRSPLIEPAVAQGFTFHHAEPSHLMLTSWLAETPCSLPANASHQVGVGCFVLNADGAVLAVQERTGPAAVSGFWKLPTGLVTQGEPIAEAAVREVEEETGVRTEFVGIIGFRQAHGVVIGGKDDLFFLCALRLLDPQCTELMPQESEIAAACWMPLDDFTEMPHVADKSTVWGHLHSMCVRWARGAEYMLAQPRLLPLGFRPGHNVVYTVGDSPDSTPAKL